MTGPRPVGELLAGERGTLAALVRRCEQRRLLDQRLGEFLDRPLSDHVQVASAADGTLVLAADTPVWGHRIRYLAPAILERLRDHDASLRDVRIIVRPQPDRPAPVRTGRRPTLSPSTASLLERIAQTCDNPGLARILARLGARAR